MKKMTLVAATLIAALSQAAFAQEEGPGPQFDFAAMDANKDGKLSKDEMEAYQTAKVTAMDTNGDGFISAEEMSADMLAKMQARLGEIVKKRIDARDDNGDGKLSMDEMSAGEGAQRMFNRADQDNDGMLSQAEIDAMLKKMAEHRGQGRGHDGGHGGWFGMKMGDDQ